MKEPTNVEQHGTSYLEALRDLSEDMWAECVEIASELGLSLDDIVRIAIAAVDSKLVDVIENRQFIAVDAGRARIYSSALELHISEADDRHALTYAELVEHLRASE